MNQNKCAFCSFKPNDPRIINFGEHVISFLANPRITPGHCLVIPKRHVDDPRDLSDIELVAINREMDRLTTKLLQNHKGVDRWQKYRPEVAEGTGAKMNHVHFHLLPSNPGEDLYDKALKWGEGAHQPLSESELKQTIKDMRES